MRQAGLEDRHELSLVAREAARHERRAERQRQQRAVDRLHRVGLALLAGRALVGRRRELALRQAVDAVVLEDVEQVHVAADGVRQLAEADRQRVAVARDADEDQVAVGGVGARGHRRHAAVHAVEAVRVAQEIGRRLRRAADARELRHTVRLDRQLPERLDDGGRDRVVAAAGAERGDGAFVVAPGQPDRVLLQRGMVDLGFRNVMSCRLLQPHAACSSFACTPAIT